MIDLPTQKDLATPHHRKAVGALIASIVIFGIVLTVYFLRPAPEPASPLQEVGGWTEADTAVKEAILANIRANANVAEVMSAAEIKQKQDILKEIRNR